MQDESDIHKYFRDYATSRHKVFQADVDGFRDVLETAKSERAPQLYLQEHPQLLCCFLRSGHGEWVVPQKRLGAEYVPDFVVGCGNSGGIFWNAIELESPNAKFVIKNGQPTRELRTAISQIEDWRRWLESNLDYARRAPSRNGLGLEEISPQIPSHIVIGRSSDLNARFNALRKTYYERSMIEIITYDGLLERFAWIKNVVHPITSGDHRFDEMRSELLRNAGVKDHKT